MIAKPTFRATTNVVTKEASSDVLFNLVNNWRIANNKEAYIRDPDLCTYANKRLLHVQAEFSHNLFDTTVAPLIDNKKFKMIGENLSKDESNEGLILSSWLASPTHRSNLDDAFTHSCLACKNSYCVQLFGVPASGGAKTVQQATTSTSTNTFECITDKCGTLHISRSACETGVCCELNTGWVWSDSAIACRDRQDREYQQYLQQDHERNQVESDNAQTELMWECLDMAETSKNTCYKDCDSFFVVGDSAHSSCRYRCDDQYYADKNSCY